MAKAVPAIKEINPLNLPEIEELQAISDPATKIVVQFLNSLPDKELKKIAKTQDQFDFLQLCEFDARLCSQYWASLLTLKNDPLDLLIESGEIDEHDREHTVRTVDVYQRLWELIQLSEKHIRSEVERRGGEYPWQGIYSAASLMSTILGSWINSKAEAFLAPYCKASVKDSAAIACFAKQVLKGEKPIQPSKVKPILAANSMSRTTIGVAYFWLVRQVCFEKSKRDRLIKEKLEALDKALNNLASFVERSAKQKRPSKSCPNPARSYEMRRGVVYRAGTTGGTYT